nr:uncharacterized protein LOC123755474 [Procambarus clarkii]
MAKISFDVKISEAFGYFNSYEKALQEINAFQRNTGTFFCQAWSHIKESNHSDVKPGAHKIFWNDGENSRIKKCHLEFDGLPYIVLGSRIYDCQYGVDRNLNHKRRYKESQMKGENLFKKRYHRVPGTKKQDCPAQIYLREIIKFPNFRITSNTEYYRKKASSQVQNAIKEKNACGERRTYVHFPYMIDHKNHSVAEIQGLKYPIDSRVKRKIEDLVAEGVTDSKALKTSLRQFVQTEIFAGQDSPSKSNRHFFPKKSEIENCVNLSTIKLRISESDQEDVEIKIREWQQCQPEDKFYFRPYADVTDETSFHPPDYFQQLLVVYQTKWQCQLLDWYGQELCILDGTYKNLDNSLLLFFLAVKTDVDYQVVGSFIVQSETEAAVKEALNIFKEWNPQWKPSVFMSDFSRVEMAAIEQTFPDVQVLICDFQREQSWERWALNADNGIYSIKDEVLSHLRTISHSSSIQEFNEAEQHLFSSDFWIKNPKLQKWFGKIWLPEHQRWVWAYRKDHLLNTNTYSGIEQLNETFKCYYIKCNNQNALSGLLSILVEYFLPDLYTKCLQETTAEEIETNIPEESPVYEEPKENLALKCREVIDHICNYTYLLEDPLILRELYESLLIAYDTVLDYAEGKRGSALEQKDTKFQSSNITRLTKKSTLKLTRENREQILRVQVQEKSCVIPETYEVLESVEDNKFGDLVVGSSWTHPQSEVIDSCVTYDTVLESTSCINGIESEQSEETLQVKPLQITKKIYLIQPKEKVKNNVKVCVGEKSCIMPGIFQLLVPVEQNIKDDNTEMVEEKPTIMPETYQVLVPVEDNNKIDDLMVGPEWTHSQSGDVASYVTVSDTGQKKRKQIRKGTSLLGKKMDETVSKAYRSGKSPPKAQAVARSDITL